MGAGYATPNPPGLGFYLPIHVPRRRVVVLRVPRMLERFNNHFTNGRRKTKRNRKINKNKSIAKVILCILWNLHNNRSPIKKLEIRH